MTLREARDLVRLSQGELADRAGVNASAISDIERGKVRKPSHDLVTRIVRALKSSGLPGVTAEQLFPVTDENGAAA